MTTAPYPSMVPGSCFPQVEYWASSCLIDILIKMWRFLPAVYSSKECMCISVNLPPHYRLVSVAVCVCDLPVSFHLFHLPLPQKWLSQPVGHGASLITGCSISYSSFFLNLASESCCFNIPQLEFKNTLHVSYKQLLSKVMLIKKCGLLKQYFFIIVAFILILMSVQLESLQF